MTDTPSPEAPIDFSDRFKDNTQPVFEEPKEREDAFDAIVRLSRGFITTRIQAIQVAGMILIVVIFIGLYIASATPPLPPDSAPMPKGQHLP